MAEIAPSVANCTNVASGCFGAHPETLDYMRRGGVGDLALSEATLRFATAAMKAGEAGTPLEDATYAEVTIQTEDEGLGLRARFGEGEQQRIGDLTHPDSRRLAACGLAVDCPLRGNGTNL
jgi:hypothetical protein